MKYTKPYFEEAAARVRCLDERDRKSHAISLIERFKGTNPKFDPDKFMASCGVAPGKTPLVKAYKELTEKAVSIELREVQFTLGYQWNKADVDAALVPHFSVFCGNVQHEVGKDDLAGGGYDSGEADKTPLANSISALQDYLRMHQKWPKGVEAKAVTGMFIQGYADVELIYDGPLAKLELKIAECQEIIRRAIPRFVRYYQGGETIRNSTVNAFAGPGFDAKRIL